MEDHARGDLEELINTFHHSKVKFNLPHPDFFDPILPWILKWNVEVNTMSGDLVSFVDYMRATGNSVENFWQCVRSVSSNFKHREIQEAYRQRAYPNLITCAWDECMDNMKNSVDKNITQENWTNAKIT